MDEFPSAVYGWRTFALRGDGLIPPFVALGQPVDADVWARGPNFARCWHSEEHFAPDDDCTCGFRATEDLSLLLGMSRSDKLWASDVLARVKLWGKIRPGTDIPNDDPPTTWRASQARLLELHLAPEHLDAADALYDRYEVPIRTYSEQAWPSKVAAIPPPPPFQPDVPGFIAAVRGAGLGLFMFDHPVADERLASLGESLVQGMRMGVTRGDSTLIVYKSKARPTMPQSRAMVAAAVRYLAPDCASLPDVPMCEQPPTPLSVLRRSLGI